MSERVVVGQRNAGEYGIWVSKPGKSAWSTNINDFLLTADLSQTYPVKNGVVLSIPNVSYVPSSTPYGVYVVADYYLAVPHDLGYVPLVIVTGLYGGTNLEVTSSDLIFRYRYSGPASLYADPWENGGTPIPYTIFNVWAD